MDFSTLLVQCLNAVQYGLLLFLVASGLTLIFGIMGVINLAHGSFYMLGAYMAFLLSPHFAGDFIGMLLVGVLLAAVFFACTLLLAYFGNLRPADSGSVLERTSVTAPVPAPAASGAAQIPGTTAPATPAPVPAPAPAVGASGAVQIPTK